MTWFRVFSFETLDFCWKSRFQQQGALQILPTFSWKTQKPANFPFLELETHPRLGLVCLACPFLGLLFHRNACPFVEHICRANKGPGVGKFGKKKVLIFSNASWKKSSTKKNMIFSAENMVIFYIPTQLSHLPTKTVLISLSANASDASKAYICHARMKNH